MPALQLALALYMDLSPYRGLCAGQIYVAAVLRSGVPYGFARCSRHI